MHLQYASASLSAILVSAAPKENYNSLTDPQTFTHELPSSHIFV